MGFRIQSNIAAINSFNFLNKNSASMNKSLERLSSGYRINSAADDAAGLSSSMRMRAEISSLKVASRNTSEATSMLQVAEGAMGQIDLILNRMKELATQAASGNAGEDLSKINSEAQALSSEVDRIVGFTAYNGVTLLDGTFGVAQLSTNAGGGFVSGNGVTSIDLHGATSSSTYTATVTTTAVDAGTMQLSDGTTSQTVDISAAMAVDTATGYAWLDFTDLDVKVKVDQNFGDATTGDVAVSSTDSFVTLSSYGNETFQIGSENNSNNQLGFTLSGVNMSKLKSGSTLSVDLYSQSSAQTALADIDTAISYLAGKRAEVGTLVNRLGYAGSNLSVSIENKTASESVIRDVDMASEMSEFTKSQILVQASTSMLAQANSAPQSVLSLLG